MTQLNQRLIAHVDMDAFYASVEVLDHPELRGKPVIVGQGKRGVVSAASYEARRYGVRSAMPVFQARAACPQGVFLPVRMPRYQEVSRRVMEVLGSFSPLVEPISVDEAFLDLTGCGRLWGEPLAMARAIKQRVRQATGLTCSVGMAPVRFAAKIASDRDKPDGLTLALDLEAFLATVKLAEVPGVGRKAAERLKAMGMTRLVEVRALSAAELGLSFGKWGLRLHELSWGIDETPIAAGRPVKSISHELTLAEDTSSRDILALHLLAMSRKVAARLRAKDFLGRTVVLKLKDNHHRLFTRSHTLEEPFRQSSLIHRTALELLAAFPKNGPFRLVGVGVSGLIRPGDVCNGLFDDRQAREKENSLGRAEDAISRKHGAGRLLRAGELGLRNSGPERE